MALTNVPTEFQSEGDYKRAKGIPTEKISIQMDFWRASKHPSLMGGINDGNLQSFYEAPMVIKDKNLINTVSVPETPSQPMQFSPTSSSSQGSTPASSTASPCCGTKLEQLNRTRVRCTSCGAEYHDNESM